MRCIETFDLLRAIPDKTPANVAAALDHAVATDASYWVRPTTIDEAAAFLGTTVASLRQARHLGNGPPSFKADDTRAVMYAPRVELLAWQRAKYGLDPIPDNPERSELLRKASVAFSAEEARKAAQRREREERRAANDSSAEAA